MVNQLVDFVNYRPGAQAIECGEEVSEKPNIVAKMAGARL